MHITIIIKSCKQHC